MALIDLLPNDAESLKRDRLYALDAQVTGLVARLEQQIEQYHRTHAVSK